MKGNDGRARRKALLKRIGKIISAFVVFILLLHVSGIRQSQSSGNDDDDDRFHQPLPDQKQQPQKLRRHPRQQQQQNPNEPTYKNIDHSTINLIFSGSIHLVDINVKGNLKSSDTQDEAVIEGEFCRLNFALHKQNPSSVPMFRDLVRESPQCSTHRWKGDIMDIAKQVKLYDKHHHEPDDPKNLPVTGVVFHESRCGSTLVANSLIAMNPDQHRVYSESAPPLKALGLCGDSYERCSQDMAVQVLQNVMFLMGRTNDVDEEHMFFKIQSAGTNHIHTFTKAFPTVPWLFVYRDPVQVMMSHLSHGAKNANCVRTKRNPPKAIQQLLQQHDYHNSNSMGYEMYCAAHLARICQSAVHELEATTPHLGTPVNYVNLPQYLYESWLPKILHRPMNEEEISNIMKISTMYSKGRGGREGTWHEDSQQKTKTASNEIVQASQTFLQESYDILESYTSSNIAAQEDEKDIENDQDPDALVANANDDGNNNLVDEPDNRMDEPGHFQQEQEEDDPDAVPVQDDDQQGGNGDNNGGDEEQEGEQLR